MAEVSRQIFSRILSGLRIFSQVFCVMPVIDFSGKVSVPQRLHNIWCLTILICIYIASFTQAKALNLKRPTVETVLYLSEFFTNCAIVTMIISSAYYYAEQYRKLPEQLSLFEDMTKNYEMGKPFYAVLWREVLLLCVSAGSFLLACFIIDLISNEYDILQTLRSFGAYNLPNLMTSLNLAQYWLALRFICLLYRRLNNGLQKILLCSENAEQYPELMDETQKNDLPWNTMTDWYRKEFPNSIEKTAMLSEFVDYIRDLYSELDALLSKLVDIFGFLIILNFFGSFLDLAIEYFAVYKFYDNSDSYSTILFVYKVMWLVLHTGKISFILLTNHTVIREKCRTFYILNELPTTSKDIEHAINRFQLHLMVRRAAETACGIIDLDLLFFGGFNSALATYIIFLIQTDLGNVSLQPTKVATNKTN